MKQEKRYCDECGKVIEKGFSLYKCKRCVKGYGKKIKRKERRKYFEAL